jgi:hypothetical protein
MQSRAECNQFLPQLGLGTPLPHQFLEQPIPVCVVCPPPGIDEQRCNLGFPLCGNESFLCHGPVQISVLLPAQGQPLAGLGQFCLQGCHALLGSVAGKPRFVQDRGVIVARLRPSRQHDTEST